MFECICDDCSLNLHVSMDKSIGTSKYFRIIPDIWVEGIEICRVETNRQLLADWICHQIPYIFPVGLALFECEHCTQ